MVESLFFIGVSDELEELHPSLLEPAILKRDAGGVHVLGLWTVVDNGLGRDTGGGAMVSDNGILMVWSSSNAMGSWQTSGANEEATRLHRLGRVLSMRVGKRIISVMITTGMAHTNEHGLKC